MKAAILVEQKRPLVIDDLDVPNLGYGQVLVKLVCSGICGTQLGEIDGVKGPDKFLPHLLGHEGGGVVLDVGPGVAKVKRDDHVVLHWRKGSGIEAATPKYRWLDNTVNAGWVTTFNEVAIISENRLTRIPADVSLEAAALLGCAVTTGMGVVVNNAKLCPGESIVVYGAGGVGLNVIQGAALVSADPIVAVDISKQKLEMASKLGATHVVDASCEDPREALQKIFSSTGADVVVETTGAVKNIELAYELTGPRGRTILVGVPPKGNSARLYTLPLHFGKVIVGSHGGEANPDEDIPRYVNLYRRGKLRLDELITDRFNFSDINSAIQFMREGKHVGRCLVWFD